MDACGSGYVSRQRFGWICAGVVAGALIVFSGTCRNGFVDIDDGEYATNNPILRNGFSTEAFRWAFSLGASSSWHPLTWCSHLLDWQLFGAWPAGHHLSSLLWHAGAAVLAVLIFGRLAGGRAGGIGAAFGAAWWAWHPLRVESVAWVAERKDVMCAFFFLLAVWCHLRWSEAERLQQPKGNRWLGAVWLAGACACLCKGMGVTLPLALLLLDVWPLKRFGGSADLRAGLGGRGRLISLAVVEKAPLWAVAAGTAALTYVAQHGAGAVSAHWPPSERLANASTALVAYWRDMAWPSGLAFFYPHPDRTPPLRWILAAAAIVLASGLAWRLRKSRPWWLFALAWFVIVWLPVSGLVQAGLQARADRFAYLPSLGLAFALASEAERAFALPRSGGMARMAGGVWVILLGLCSFKQTEVWRDARTLFTHATLVTEDNYYAFFALGDVAKRAGNIEEATRRFGQSLEIYPGFAPARFGLGLLLQDCGSPEGAIEQFRAILILNPDDVQTHVAMGAALSTLGRREEAITSYREALRIEPGRREANFQIAQLCAVLNRTEESMRAYEAELLVQPDYPAAHNNLANLLVRAGRANEALPHYDAAVLARPDYAEAWVNAGLALWRLGEKKAALSKVRRAFFLNDRLPGLSELLMRMESESSGL